MSRILVVDDDRDMQALLRAYLEAAGHSVKVAGDGVSGVHAMATEIPDLIVTDFQMPRMDGFGLFIAARSDPRTARLPVVMVTAHNSRDMMNKALGLGVDDFLGKPVTQEELLRVIGERLLPATAPAPPPAPRPPGALEFFGSVLCCGLCSLERFALALKKEELDELLGRFASDAALPVQRDGGWLTRADFHHLYGTFEVATDAPDRPHALRALRSALGVVLAAQRLKPWIASRFAGRDLPEFVVALGVHTGKIQLTPGPAGPALHGEAAEIAAFLAESALSLHWSVAASRAAAKSSGFAFLSGRGAQLRMPKKAEGTVKAVEVKGLLRPAGPAPQPSRAATLIEAAVDRNATLVTFTRAAPKPPEAPPSAVVAAPAPPTPKAAPAKPAPKAASAKAAPKAAPPKPAPKVAPPRKEPPPKAAPAPAPTTGSDPFAGRTVVRKLADNGVVAVYLANPVAGGPQEVVKTVVITDDARKPKKGPALQRLVEQYATLAAVEHPNIARITAQGRNATHLFVTQEYCPGGDLRNLIADRMVADDVVKALIRITGGLRAAHQKGFVHGDLKPSNVMIRADGGFVLVDFGLAAVSEYAVGEGESGVIMRAPDYLSPELINGQRADVSTDIYTLGLLLHEMLTGKRAYESPDLSKVMMDHLSAPVPKLPPEFERFQGLLDKLMAKDGKERFASVPDVIAFMAQAKLQIAQPAAAATAPFITPS